MYTASDIDLMRRVHKNAPLELHGQILFGNMQVAGIPFAKLYVRSLRNTGTRVAAWKVFRRAQRAYNLARYYEYACSLEGSRVECGVFAGFSALMCCQVNKALDKSFDGGGLYLVDSYEGLSDLGEEDLVEVPDGGGTVRRAWKHGQGHFATDLPTVAGHLGEFPGITYVKGWIPPVLSELPQTTWSFVHIDVDLYEPTLACLEYFLPRLAPGGVIVNDDFGSPGFPGGGKSWKEFFERRNLPYVILDSGQAVYIQG
jgi:hypothetical protein